MTRKYSTTHCLDLDEDGVASALITVRLQGVSLLRATMFVDAVPASQAKLSQLFMNKTLCKKCQAEVSA